VSAWLAALLLAWGPLLAAAAPAAGSVVRSGVGGCGGVALTFDLCPVREAPGFDESLVAFLERTGTPATFFLSGRWVLRHEDQTRALLRTARFEVGSHGMAHLHLPALEAPKQREEIADGMSLLRTRFGAEARLFRPPYGEYDGTTEQLLDELGLQGVLWSVVSGDPDPALSAEQILARVSGALRPGSIVVFHANGKGRHTREVVQALVERVLPEKGLRPMTVSELLACRVTPR
jgi:peptidoglycan/xylan/chitin deacetylase (PgdA/CDA1 family)